MARAKSCECQRLALTLLWESVEISTPYRTYLPTRLQTHVSNLCEFRYDPSSSLEPIEVAARNAGEFFIDRIYDHRGTTTKRLNMEFLVSWKDNSQKGDTWEPYKAVCKTQAFVDYCYANKLTSLVNKTLCVLRVIWLALSTPKSQILDK